MSGAYPVYLMFALAVSDPTLSWVGSDIPTLRGLIDGWIVTNSPIHRFSFETQLISKSMEVYLVQNYLSFVSVK